MPAPTADDVTWCSPLGLMPVYDAFSPAEGATRRHLCPDCGASVEAHCHGDQGYVPAHPVRDPWRFDLLRKETIVNDALHAYLDVSVHGFGFF